MKRQIDDYSDVLVYLDTNGLDQETRIINLRGCKFNLSLDLNLLFHTLWNKYYDFDYLDFSDSIFQGSVELSMTNQQSVNDDRNNFIGFNYLKTKINIEMDFNSCQFIDAVRFSGVEFSRDLNFINAVFEKKVEFSDLVFKRYLRLFEASFHDDVNFANLELNDKSIFFTKNDNRTKFVGNLYFFNIVFLKAKFWDFVFSKDVYFINTVFDCPAIFNNAKFLGKTVFSSVETIGLTEFKNKLYFDNAEINDLNLEKLVFEKVVSFNYAIIKNISIENVHCYGFPMSLVGTSIGNVKNEGTARFLKSEAMKSNDPFLIAELNTKEMNMHYKGLSWSKKDFFDKLIFFLNKNSTNFGNRWEKGVLFIFISWIFSFSLIAMLRDGIGGTFIWCDKVYLKEAVDFLWKFGSLDVLGNNTWWVDIFVFITGKILIAYGVYQTITAFRKYGRK